MTENRQDVSYNFVGKAQGKEGFDITRLVSPPFDQINEDFLCGICQSKFNPSFLTLSDFSISSNLIENGTFINRNRERTRGVRQRRLRPTLLQPLPQHEDVRQELAAGSERV